MTTKSLLLASSVLALLAGTGTSMCEAATITNHDAKAYDIVVVEGEQEKHITVEPDQSVDNICATACTLAITPDSEIVEIAQADELLIEEGQVYLLEPQTGGENPSEANDVQPKDQMEPGLDPQPGQER